MGEKGGKKWGPWIKRQKAFKAHVRIEGKKYMRRKQYIFFVVTFLGNYSTSVSWKWTAMRLINAMPFSLDGNRDPGRREQMRDNDTFFFFRRAKTNQADPAGRHVILAGRVLFLPPAIASAFFASSLLFHSFFFFFAVSVFRSCCFLLHTHTHLSLSLSLSLFLSLSVFQVRNSLQRKDSVVYGSKDFSGTKISCTWEVLLNAGRHWFSCDVRPLLVDTVASRLFGLLVKTNQAFALKVNRSIR